MFGGELDAMVMWLDSRCSRNQQTVVSGGLFGSDTHLTLTGWESSPSDALLHDVVRHSGTNWTSFREGIIVTRQAAGSGTFSNGLWSCLHDLFGAAYESGDGDRGGTVWRPDPYGQKYLVGIHKGGLQNTRAHSHISWPKSKFGLDKPYGL